jgi:hypothetical protein
VSVAGGQRGFVLPVAGTLYLTDTPLGGSGVREQRRLDLEYMRGILLHVMNGLLAFQT